jgi:hypothetical protein
MRALPIAIVLSSVGGTVCAQPANGRVTGLDPCFQLARAAAAICYDPTNGAVERLDCQKTRATLGECLAHAARSAPPPAGTGSSEMPSGTTPPELRPSAVSPNKSTGIGSPSSPNGAVPSKKPSATVLPDKPTGTVAPELPAAAGLVGARSANESMTGLESCFQAARIADAICSKLPNDPAQRLDCFQKTRAAQLECLERVLSETPAGPTTPKAPSETTRPEPSATATLPEAPSERVSPKQPSQTGSSEKSDSPPKAIVSTKPPELPAPTATPTGAIRPDIRPKTADVPVGPTGTNWVVSETTSPVDYSPLVTALTRSTSPAKDAPTTLAVRCRGKHTELLVRTDGTWATTRGNELRIDYQINDQPAVRLPWTASADGKTASYKGDAVGLLQSLPEGARLKINVFDGPGPGHDATFQLTGLDTVRQKIAVACNGRK